MNKLTSVESQRVMSVLGDMLDRLSFLTYVPAKADSRLLSQLRETGCATGVIETQWQLEDAHAKADSDDNWHKVKVAARSLCRHMRENPVFLNTFFGTPTKEPADDLLQFIKFLSELTDLSFAKLGKTVEEETTHQELMDTIYNRRKQAEDELVSLRDKLSELRKAKEDETSHLDIQLQKLKAELSTINKNTNNELAMIQAQVKETLDKAFEKQNIDIQALNERHLQLTRKLEADTTEHRDAEDGLRKAKCKIGVEVAATIEKYDAEMTVLATEIDTIQAQYTKELKELHELSEHFKKARRRLCTQQHHIDEEQRRIDAEEKVLEAVRAEERRQVQVLHDAATKIQKVFRGNVVRKELAAKKKGKKGGKGKGKKKK